MTDEKLNRLIEKYRMRVDGMFYFNNSENVDKAKQAIIDYVEKDLNKYKERFKWLEANFPKAWELNEEGLLRLEKSGFSGKNLGEAIDNAIKKDLEK